MTKPIFIFSGAPASGKSSVSKALLQRFPFGLHLPIDTLRGFVISGLSNPIGSWDPETDRQFRLARDSAALVAKTYAQAGFAVAIDDVIFPPDVSHHYETVLADFDLCKILLRPGLAVHKARNQSRQLEMDNQLLEAIIEPIYDHFASFDLQTLNESGWCILDTSQDTIEETVATILDWCENVNVH